MVKPSKGGAIFLTCFGLIFLVPSLLAAFTFLTKETGSTAEKFAGVAIALLMASIGAGLIYAAIAGYGKMKQQAAVEEANPQAPWLWRQDWAGRTARSQNRGRAVVLWVICFFLGAILFPISFSAIPKFTSLFDPGALILLVCDAGGLVVLGYAVRATLRQRRFGDTTFEFYALPFCPGDRVSGRIHLQLDATATHGIDLRLSCVRKTITGSGDNSSTHETVLWEAEQNAPAGAIATEPAGRAIATEPAGRAIPVDFTLPADAYVTDHDNPRDQILWLLHAQADVPGVNYTDDFEVPVFRTSSSPSVSSTDSFAAPSTFGFSAASSAETNEALPAPKNPRVVITPQGNGTEFYFPPLRNPGRTFLLLIFTAIWSGFVYLLFHSGAPWLFAIVFGLADVFLLFALLHSSFGSMRICIGDGQLTRSSRILGLGSTRHFSVSEIAAILPVTGGQQSTGNGSATYLIRLLTRSGKRVTLADDITSRQEARWIVSQMETLAGLKLDTRVQFDAPLGVSSLPPPPAQPGQPVFTSRSGRTASRGASLIGLAVFAGVAILMFTTQIRRASAFRAAANSRAHRPQPARSAGANRTPSSATPAAAKPQPPALTDEDAQRILSLPPQEQAEELLERAIGHDPKALALFDAHVEDWVGHIRLSDRMRQLENRSQYSTDLRVRYANADIYLTLDGWQKNEQAADLLISRAKTDLHYRPAAVFFLGMLAGRGVAYDRIHPVLLDYAQHDPDASVRQWAVEGMRYLGKDEALDELWESFTQDPSMQVRDRAGCNISDCGNFTRRQRMRMVPKFLELLGDRDLNPQMRNWCFMALHEITDANVPGDAQAWRNWYGQHGAAKLAEFEQLDWWQVRGDE